MGKALLVVMGVMMMGGPAAAQTTGNPPRVPTQNGGAGIRSGFITSSGETVPHPGASQSGGTTALDKGVERQDNRIESGICKGC